MRRKGLLARVTEWKTVGETGTTASSPTPPHPPAPREAGWISAWLLPFNLYPAQWSGTDGRELRELCGNDARAERQIALMRINHTALQGVRPRDWDTQHMQQMLVPADQGLKDLTAHSYAYHWCLDRGDLPSAERHLVYAIRHRKRLSPAARASLILEAAFFECRYRANQADADRWLKKLGKEARLTSPYAQARLACVAHLALDQHAEGQQIARELLQVIQLPQDGFSIAERDNLQAMINLSIAQQQAGA